MYSPISLEEGSSPVELGRGRKCALGNRRVFQSGRAKVIRGMMRINKQIRDRSCITKIG
jgi:hypothetical protein